MSPALARQRGRIVALAALLGCGLGASAGCYDFTFVEPPPRDAGGDALPDGGCVLDQLYCGGDLLRGDTASVYRCLADGGGGLVKKCASGCLRDGNASANGRCVMPTSPCQVGGSYCGGDKLDGDPAVLYRCATGGTAEEKERCAKGCQVAKSGLDDACVK